MAASLLLRQGRARALKTIFLEARVFRGLASTVSLSAESGKSEKGQPPNLKKQSPPKTTKGNIYVSCCSLSPVAWPSLKWASMECFLG
nr:PREDICTED: NADH dehydrogenase [ubiquinone] flavoprotein 3, mitochondrial isoform X1 [Equus przewalskii]